ncbi:hypothetical protein [Paeniglutamicibacter sp.]|uniref:hypothetical protein n=1 Tax=Paeniglutamicibacter sp. TaxID=1934391 RepID=UPI00398A16A8
MEFEEQKLYSDLIVAYRQRLDVAIFEMERAVAQSSQKDGHIAELTRQLESARATQDPSPGAASHDSPKPLLTRWLSSFREALCR